MRVLKTAAMAGWLIPALICALAATATADIKTLQNDAWVDNTAAGFQGGFTNGEMAGAVFVSEDAEDYPMELRTLRFLFGGNSDGQTRDMGIRIWLDDGGPQPGALIYEGEFEVTSSDSAFSEIDLGGTGLVIQEGRFRVGIEFRHQGFPGVARDDDAGSANDFADRNYIFAQGIGWVRAQDLGVLGDWIIRMDVNTPGGNGGPNNGTNNGTGGTNNGTGGTNNGTGGTNNGTTPTDALAVTGVNPTEGVAGTTTAITILGAGFDASTSFRMGSTTLDSIQIPSPTAATAVVPVSLGAGTYDLIATNAAGDTVVFPQGFTLRADDGGGTNNGTSNGDLGLVSVNPSTATNDAPTDITIVGAGFVAGVTTFRIGSTNLEDIRVQSDTAATAEVPAGITPGTYDVIASNGTDQAVFSQGFTVTAASSGGGDDGCATAPGTPNPALGALLLAALVGLIARRRQR